MEYWKQLLHVKLSKNLTIKAIYDNKECFVIESYIEFEQHFIDPYIPMRNRF